MLEIKLWVGPSLLSATAILSLYFALESEKVLNGFVVECF
jgi:hypothetical protein